MWGKGFPILLTFAIGLSPIVISNDPYISFLHVISVHVISLPTCQFVYKY